MGEPGCFIYHLGATGINFGTTLILIMGQNLLLILEFGITWILYTEFWDNLDFILLILRCRILDFGTKWIQFTEFWDKEDSLHWILEQFEFFILNIGTTLIPYFGIWNNLDSLHLNVDCVHSFFGQRRQHIFDFETSGSPSHNFWTTSSPSHNFGTTFIPYTCVGDNVDSLHGILGQPGFHLGPSDKVFLILGQRGFLKLDFWDNLDSLCFILGQQT